MSAGRPIKQGLDYFPLNVDFFTDDKIEYVTARFDEKGELIAIKLLCSIYKNGYYTDWNDDKALIFAKRAGNGISPSLASDVVYELVKRGFFDGSIFNSFAILTSRGIQKRYLKAVTERAEIEIISDYWLIEMPKSTSRQNIIINLPNNSINLPNNSINLPENAQSKVKESKAKNSKAKESKKDIVDTGVPTTLEYPRDSVEYMGAKYLADKILKNNPSAANIPRNDQDIFKWCVHIDRLLRIDKRPRDELREVLIFAAKDPFWSTNILSTKKLREKYDTLLMQMKRANERHGTPPASGGRVDTLSVLESMMDKEGEVFDQE